MFRSVGSRGLHFSILAVVAGLLFFFNLGVPSLWDIDEGNNGEAAREMHESHDLVVPTFNYELRVDKPALLYWLQIAGYRAFGISEFSARLPSALAALLAVLVTCELGRLLFGANEGLMAGLILASSIAFCAAAHFANPDALLCLCTTATLALFWADFRRGGRTWFWSTAVTTGLGVLAKGPVGFVLPMAVIGLFLLWNRRLAILRDRRVWSGAFLFWLVVLPWYVWVTADTRGSFLIGFLLHHNLGRALSPMENHQGLFFYYLIVLAVGTAPWSVFLAWTVWFGTGKRAQEDGASEARGMPETYRFLWSWIGVYLVFFSLVATKLPNYILPLYPPLALLTARFAERWRTSQIQVAVPIRVSLGVLAWVGIVTAVALLAVGGRLPGDLLHGRYLPGLGRWAWLGAIPLTAAVLAWWCLNQNRQSAALTVLCLMAVLFTGGLIAGASVSLDLHKAPRPLVASSGACQTDREVRVGAFAYFQPSLVFYCRREVTKLDTESQTRDFLRSPVPVFLFIPETAWQSLQATVPSTCKIVARHYELYRHCQVLVVTNR